MKSAQEMYSVTSDTINIIDRQAQVMSIIEGSARQGDSVVYIDFEKIGYEWKDVQWLQLLGYSAYRNSPCRWWEIRWDGL